MTPERGMTMALALAHRGQGCTGRNPSVGCVIVRNDRVLGRGRTAEGGRPHAETRALADAAQRYGAEALRGATAFVTLEPCAHYGHTPPCATALIEAGIAQVIAPIPDPDPRVAGKGFAILREAGIDVIIGPGEREARAILAPYLRMRATGRPTVTLKLATTLDGKIATRTGESQWITGADARQRVHLLRAQSDAILVGIGTVLADDPGLDVRLPGMAESSPAPIIADRALRTPPTARLLARGKALVVGDAEAHPDRAAALRDAGATVAQAASDTSATALLGIAAQYGHASIFCEGGATLATALISEDCVDHLVWFTGGAIIGADGRGALDPLDIDHLADAPHFRQVSVQTIGPDMVSVWTREQETP